MSEPFTLETLQNALALMPAEPQQPAFSRMFGMQVHIDPHLPFTRTVEVGHWLNGYRPSKNRSKRLIKKLVHGTRKRKPVVKIMTEQRVIEAFMFCNRLILSPRVMTNFPPVLVMTTTA